jgi:hypothetical protein
MPVRQRKRLFPGPLSPCPFLPGFFRTDMPGLVLAVGYAALTTDILNEYFDTYFPRAATVAQQLRARGGQEQLRWLTQSYVVGRRAHFTHRTSHIAHHTCH